MVDVVVDFTFFVDVIFVFCVCNVQVVLFYLVFFTDFTVKNNVSFSLVLF